MKRRTFIKSTATASLFAGIPLKAFSTPKANLNILVLGGRDFLGPAIVDAALDKGHRVTLFNRNQTNPDMYPGLPLIIGDRATGNSCYSELIKSKWDVVIDVWPQQSQLVDEATQALKEHTKHYMFISSIAVYADYRQVGLRETAETVELPQDRTNWGYSEEKCRSEQFIKERFPDNHTILRPGPIKGWRDPAVDLAYWLLRIRDNKQVLAPGTGNDPIQFIDVKDVGGFTIDCAEREAYGIFNTTGPLPTTMTFRDFLDSCKAHTKSNAEIVWVDEAFLREQRVRSFDDLPLWVPLYEDPGFMQISNEKATRQGFRYSPATSTYADILQWYDQGLGGSHQFGREHDSVGLTTQREQELLSLWSR